MPTDFESSSAYRVLARRLLEQAPGFDQCPAPTIDALLEGAGFVRLRKNEVLLRRGDPCDALILLVEGALESSIASGKGRRHLLTFILPGMLVGILPFVDGGGVVHDTVAHVPSVVLRMPAQVVRSQRATDPMLHIAFEVQLASRSRRLYDLVAEGMLHSLRERLSQQLLELVNSFGLQRGKEWTIALRLPQSDLADLLGATRQSVNNELRDMEDCGLIRIEHSHIDVLDLAALQAECSKMLDGP
ncbi:Crp/Fnr family transcriptional regulator [Variovorax sp. J22R133]|uniref:Crp/Fnr family transcriptional regulator n=1 Tax=Variovorax brevis TaxID=3053503 RepID=UPI0025751F85|nr:Crp/Fnr family transcriptional regulator [Variovorax sp. J22R133]MDM0114793.1 Crp/Fnr family transcriptional regulator [Variovorax sp. J22R133]